VTHEIVEVVEASAGRRRRVRAVAFLLGILTCATIVWQSSHATFTANTSNDTNIFGAGSVTIADNDGGTAMFSASALNLGPTDTATVCMGVRYTGTLTPTAIKLYTSGGLESNNSGAYGAWANDTTSEMDNYLNMQIQVASNDLVADPVSTCGLGTGFADVAAAAPGTLMSTMINTNTSYATGFASGWGTIVKDKWRVWKFIYTMSASAPNSAQLDGLKVNFVWEAQK